MVITTDGAPLIQPSLLDLANAVGLNTIPQGDFYDVVIVGGGPAGLGAAVYAASEGLKTVRRARGRRRPGRSAPGSRTTSAFPTASPEITHRAGSASGAAFRRRLLTAREVVGLEVKGPARQVIFDDGSSVLAHSVVLATGVSYRQLEASGADHLVGRGVYYGSGPPRPRPVRTST